MAAQGSPYCSVARPGNVTDRIVHGAVTDFFEVWFGTYRYPAFNVADSAIAIGAASSFLTYYSVAARNAPLEFANAIAERESVSRWNGFNRLNFSPPLFGAACYTAP